MSGIKSKIARYAEMQKNTLHNEMKNQSVKTNQEMAQMKELVDEDIKTTYKYTLHIQEVRRKHKQIKERQI